MSKKETRLFSCFSFQLFLNFSMESVEKENFRLNPTKPCLFLAPAPPRRDLLFRCHRWTSPPCTPRSSRSPTPPSLHSATTSSSRYPSPPSIEPASPPLATLPYLTRLLISIRRPRPGASPPMTGSTPSTSSPTSTSTTCT
jgi:hypothetical protein